MRNQETIMKGGTQNVDLQMVHVCALLCQIAYPGDHKEDRQALIRYGFVVHGMFEEDGTEFIVASSTSKETSIIAFRGTDGSATDIIRDLKSIALEGTGFGQVGIGFQEHADAAYETVCRIVSTTEKSVILCGHSLGAAAAQYTAARMRFEGIFDQGEVELITFGCPRVGDSRFAHATELLVPRHQRWVNANDGVPKIPWRLGRFLHPRRTRYYITTGGRILVKPCLFRVIVDHALSVYFNPLTWLRGQKNDHAISEYVRKIGKKT